MNTITVAFKKQFGVDTIVPACEQASLFCRISDTRTMSRPMLDAIKALGWAVTVQQEVRTL